MWALVHQALLLWPFGHVLLLCPILKLEKASQLATNEGDSVLQPWRHLCPGYLRAGDYFSGLFLPRSQPNPIDPSCSKCCFWVLASCERSYGRGDLPVLAHELRLTDGWAMTRTCAQNGLLAVRKRPAASYSSSMGPGLLVEFGYYPTWSMWHGDSAHHRTLIEPMPLDIAMGPKPDPFS